MLNIIKEELPIEESLKNKINLICEFAHVKPKSINGNIRKIKIFILSLLRGLFCSLPFLKNVIS